ncbi:slipin family protein [Phragmitibacter flavus]|uniref:Slipin family protein n=1 Tax=Phragmitibacter flavus TaxID=2576071 RepID=A0A5R8KC41_9BACT|nr:slipin family protein [Phragmitibacter flavus]TLD69149.1 slipin family protein [Phragmitibacter flavus]
MQISFQTIHRGIRYIVQDHQSALLFRHGRFQQPLAPGEHRFFRSGYTLTVFDQREQRLILQGQELLSADQVTLKVSSVVAYRVIDPLTTHRSADNAYAAFYSEAQFALREIVSENTAEAFLAAKADHATQLQKNLADRTQRFGIQILQAEIRDIMLPASLKKSFMSALQQRQESQAALEKARSETATLRTLANAARLIRDNPELLQLRYLETLQALSSNSLANIHLTPNIGMLSGFDKVKT